MQRQVVGETPRDLWMVLLQISGLEGRVIVRGVFSISSDEYAEKRREKRVKRERRRKKGEGEEAMAV